LFISHVAKLQLNFAEMADVPDKATHSYNNLSHPCGMSQIRGNDTKPETLARHFLHATAFILLAPLCRANTL
jgi:hypothetical protein